LKGVGVNMGKRKIMCCKVGSGQVKNRGKWLCGLGCNGIGVNLVVCTICKQWVQSRYSKFSKSLNVVVGFKCSRRVEGTWSEETMKEMEV
jgi:hypothetical protein